MHAIAIDTRALARALEEERNRAHYLDLDDGSLLSLPPGAAEPGREDKYDVDTERYLRIAPLSLEQRLELRQAFVLGLQGHALHLLLRHALEGRRPLRSFAYLIEQHPDLLQAWQRFHAARLEECALQWLEEHDLHPGGGAPIRRWPGRR